MTEELTTGQGSLPGRKDALVRDIMIAAIDANALIQEKLEAAGSSLAEARTVLTEKIRTAAGSSSDYVKGHPWKLLGLATAVGVIVGILAYRR